MADPFGLGSQLEATFINILAQALPSYQNNANPPDTVTPLIRGWWSREQKKYPLIEVQARVGTYLESAAGGVFSNPPTGPMVNTGLPSVPGLPSQVRQQTPHRGGVIQENEIDVKVSAELAPERALLSSMIRSTLFGGENSYGVDWRRVLRYYGLYMKGWHADDFAELGQDESTENVPQVFVNTITFICASEFVFVPVPVMGTQVVLVESLVIPTGQVPPWEAV